MAEDQASLLTESQRKYLKNGKTLGGDPVSNPYEYNTNIRKRLSRVLFDLNILFKQLDENELRRVFAEQFASVQFSSIKEQSDTEELYCNACDEYVESVSHDCTYRSLWYSTAPGAFAFLIWALNVNDESIFPPYNEYQPAFENFIKNAESGIEKYLVEKHDLTANASVSIELSDVTRIDEKYPSDNSHD
jgi:hypothetical protein